MRRPNLEVFPAVDKIATFPPPTTGFTLIPILPVTSIPRNKKGIFHRKIKWGASSRIGESRWCSSLITPYTEYRRNDHQQDAPHFRKTCDEIFPSDLIDFSVRCEGHRPLNSDKLPLHEVFNKSSTFNTSSTLSKLK